MRPEWLILNYCIQWSSFKKGKRKKEDTNRETKRDAPMRRMFLQGEDKKRGTILRHKFTRVYDTWSRNYISSLFLLFPLSTCLSIQPRIWCNFPATSVNCMHFRQRNHQIRCTPISCPLCEYIYPSILSLKKNKYIYIYSVCTYFDNCTRGRHVWKIQCLVLFFFFESPVSSSETSFLYLIPGNICLNFSFFFSFCTSLRIKKNDEK